MGLEQNTAQILLQNIRDLLAKEGNGRLCIGFQQLTLSGTAQRLTIPVVTGKPAQSCTITCTNSTPTGTAGRYRLDGTAPTSGVGEVIGDLDTLEITNNTNLNAAQFINVTGTTVLNIHFYA